MTPSSTTTPEQAPGMTEEETERHEQDSAGEDASAEGETTQTEAAPDDDAAQPEGAVVDLQEEQIAKTADTEAAAGPEVDEPVGSQPDVFSAEGSQGLSDPEELKAALEAMLFTSPEPLSARKLAQALGNLDVKAVREGIEGLREDYAKSRRGFQIVEVPGGWQMASEPRFAEYILALGSKKKAQSLGPAMLETLAIIAYRQPVIRAVVESIRGVESSGVIRNLLDLELIQVVGRKEVVGRPQMYGTTEKFLRTFGLTKVEDLPSIRGLREKMKEQEEREREEEARAKQGDLTESADAEGKAESTDEGAAETGAETAVAEPETVEDHENNPAAAEPAEEEMADDEKSAGENFSAEEDDEPDDER